MVKSEKKILCILVKLLFEISNYFYTLFNLIRLLNIMRSKWGLVISKNVMKSTDAKMAHYCTSFERQFIVAQVG